LRLGTRRIARKIGTLGRSLLGVIRSLDLSLDQDRGFWAGVTCRRPAGAANILHGIAKTIQFRPGRTLLNQKTIKRALNKAMFNEHQLAAAKDWAAQVHHPKFPKAKETSVRGEFIQIVLVTILGYTPYRPGVTFTIATEESLGKGLSIRL
jgi:hypothetical protein